MPISLLLLGFTALIGSISLYVTWREDAKAPTVPGVVIASSLEELSDGWTVHIRYSYEVDGERHESDELPWLKELSGLSEEEAANLVKRYAPGTEVGVHGDPTRPQGARSEDSQIRALVLLSFFAGLLLMGIGFATLRAARDRQKRRA